MIRVKKTKSNLYIIERRVRFYGIKMWWRAVSYYRGLPYTFATEEEALRYFVSNLATEDDKRILAKQYPEYIV